MTFQLALEGVLERKYADNMDVLSFYPIGSLHTKNKTLTLGNMTMHWMRGLWCELGTQERKWSPSELIHILVCLTWAVLVTLMEVGGQVNFSFQLWPHNKNRAAVARASDHRSPNYKQSQDWAQIVVLFFHNCSLVAGNLGWIAQFFDSEVSDCSNFWTTLRLN